MKPARQKATGRCEDCGAVVTFTPRTDSPYEFDWSCARTPPHRGVVSWAHKNPPPVFDAAPPPQDSDK